MPSLLPSRPPKYTDIYITTELILPTESGILGATGGSSQLSIDSLF